MWTHLRDWRRNLQIDDGTENSYADAVWLLPQVARLTGYDPNTQQPIYKTLTEVRYFEDDIMLMESPNYNSLANLKPSDPVASDPAVRGKQRSYRSFMFLPNGTTTLPRTPDAVFTLVKEHDVKISGTLPDNYRSVTLQPVTAKATMY